MLFMLINTDHSSLASLSRKGLLLKQQRQTLSSPAFHNLRDVFFENLAFKVNNYTITDKMLVFSETLQLKEPSVRGTLFLTSQLQAEYLLGTMYGLPHSPKINKNATHN